MAAPLTEVESQAIELAAEAFKTFCEDVGGMFDVAMDCEQKEVRAETIEGLKKKFKKLVAVNVVQSEGSLSGTFQLIFDQEGFFTLGGIIVMLPEKTILANRRDASLQLATSMVDAVGEAGNLLVGSWDRVFREGLKGHGHFLQKLPAFIGKPWDEPGEKIGLAGDVEFVYVPYEITIGSYPAFNCGVIFPKTVFSGSSDSDSEQAAPAGENPQDTQATPEKAGAKESDAPQDSDGAQSKQKEPKAEAVRPRDEASVKEEAPQTQPEDAIEDKTEPEQPAKDEKSAKRKSKPKRRAAEKAHTKEPDGKEAAQNTNAKEAAEVEPDSQQTGEAEIADSEESQSAQPEAVADQKDAPAEADVVDRVAEDEKVPSEENEQPVTGKISETIRKMAQSSPVLPGESRQSAIPEGAVLCASGGLLSICAKDIMKGQVTWASPDETVQQALAKMQQHDTGYLTIGQDGVLKGIISRSDITGALSPYLRSIFAKWRRPLDDATLKIRIKWIMSRPVRTVKPETPLATIMENVCRFGGCALPVVDDQGKVQGLVTVFDVFQILLKACADIPTVGKAPQAPPLT
ncbi:MAG: CBS domain-containing protein [Phycisphaerales bacterium]|nr:MAG: CBS domain-containing protein [Phycisphaerales bacterium]